MNLVLASNSPRRKEILTNAGYKFSVTVSNFCEKDSDLSPEQVALNNAIGKAKEVFSRINNQNAVVLGADTIVVLENKILGKPKTKEQAFEMLSCLSGKTHSVITGFCVWSKDKQVSKAVYSNVTFNQLSSDKINEYILTGSPFDKAGGYGIQDNFGLIKEYSGSLSNIIGLPIEEVSNVLNDILDK